MAKLNKPSYRKKFAPQPPCTCTCKCNELPVELEDLSRARLDPWPLENGSETSFRQDSVDVAKGKSDEPTNYLKGWPLRVVTLALCLAVFLASLEVSIVSTSLVAITNDLQGFSQSSWIITAYMLTYTGFLIIWAKLSDIFGRKLLVITALCIFIVFSGACAAAQSMTQLIILRAIQGIGGAGTYALVIVIFFELVPEAKFANYTSMVSGVFAIALLLGPLLGGVINQYTTWRWVFLINVPSGAIAIVALLITVPNNFPNHGLPKSQFQPLTFCQVFSMEQMARVDFLGTTLLLAATILLVAVLEEGGNQYEWNSVFVIVMLCASAVSWLAFLAWSWKVTTANGVREPVFPWRFMQSRITKGLLLTIFLTGAPFTVAVIQIPIRSQTIYGASALEAGVQLLPFALVCPIGCAITAAVVGKAKIPPLYVMLVGSMIQIVGFYLLSSLPTTNTITNAQYGYEAITGFAVGINIACLMVLGPFTVEKRDKPVAMSAVVQFRTLGGAIGLAVVTTVMSTHIKTQLAVFLPPDQIANLLVTAKAFASLPPQTLEMVKAVFAEGFDLQMRIMIAVSAAQIPAALLMWQRHQIVV